MPNPAMNERQLLEKIRNLPADKAKEVEDFVEFLSQYLTMDIEGLEAAYQAMAADQAREREALAWSEAHVDDGLDEMPKERRGNWH